MVTIALDLCPRCGGNLLAEYDTDLRVRVPFCLCCGFKRYPGRPSPLIVVAKRLETLPADADLIGYHEIENEWHVARHNVRKAISLDQLTIACGGKHYKTLFRRGDVRKWREIMVAKGRGRPRNARPDDLLTVTELVYEFGFCRDAVCRADRKGKLVPVDATALHHQYRRADVDAWRVSVQDSKQRAEQTTRANKAKEAKDDHRD
jgi:hypothetical protein